MDRRAFLKSTSLALPGLQVVSATAQGTESARLNLRAAPSFTPIVGPDFSDTAVWAFNDQVPGPEIRLKQGQPAVIRVDNALAEPTSVHWHGIRLPNQMDGVPGLTQAPIAPGASFTYRFTPPDAGTYWYHSHVNAYEQVGRGLSGPLIIEEHDSLAVDRELVWMVDDWRLLEDASISDSFGNGHDRSHAGRIGNVPTVNGKYRDLLPVRAGERIRLRLINASNARNYALSFGTLQPWIIAVDGQPVEPRVSAEPVVLGVAGRVDLVIDVALKPGQRQAVSDTFYRDSYDLVTLACEDQPLREPIEKPVPRLADNPLPRLPASLPEALDIVLEGGAMGGMREAMLGGQWQDLRQIAQQGYVWAINTVVGAGLDIAPLIDVEEGETVVLKIENRTAFPHPMHLHGHHMKLLAIDDKPVAEQRWVDSPLLMPRQSMLLAFVADNPGDWLFHCHVLEHHLAGLGALVRVREHGRAG